MNEHFNVPCFLQLNFDLMYLKTPVNRRCAMLVDARIYWLAGKALF